MQRKTIVIVGGGTAGWLTAAFLSRILATQMPGGVRISLIESEEIGIVGVGEGTFPTIRNTLMAIGIDESRFMRASLATFKQGIRFTDWVDPPKDGQHSSYFHPFSAPLPMPGGAEMLPYWLLGCAPNGASFVSSTGVQEQIVQARRAPKRPSDPAYQGTLTYAYHFDATKLAALLRDVSKELGVTHLQGRVTSVEKTDSGDIAAIVSPEHGRLTADLFIDCSGFRAELIGKALDVPFKSVKHHLFTDRAVTVQVPYERADAPLESCTVSTAQEAGWTWDIGLESRRGVGYVYSSDHTDEDRAEQVLRSYIGPMAEGLTARKLKFDTGYREKQWVGNCVAVGLSAGFFEPLESTGIMLIEVAAHLIADLFPWEGSMRPAANLFNRLMARRYERIVDFLKLHYCLSKRPEQFWQDNADPASIPESLLEKLEMWRFRPPSRFDFVGDYETFLPISYQAVLYGMGFVTNLAAASASYGAKKTAATRFGEIGAMVPRAMAELPSHRDLINRIYGVNQQQPAQRAAF
jgi:tryptophan halogenase